MRTSTEGRGFIKGWEGFRAHAYLDAVGVKTIGYGTTSSVVSPLPDFVTPAQADALLQLYLSRACEPALNRLIADHGVELTQSQFDALIDLGYNCGAGIYSDAYQIGRDLRAGNLTAARADLMHYVYAGGRVLQGLVNRRRSEQLLWDRTPPAPADPHHYLYHPTSNPHGPGLVGGPFEVEPGREVDERERVRSYDSARRHPRLHRRGLAVMRRDLFELARRLETLRPTDAAGFPGAWPVDERHLEARHDGLMARARGRQVVK